MPTIDPPWGYDDRVFRCRPRENYNDFWTPKQISYDGKMCIKCVGYMINPITKTIDIKLCEEHKFLTVLFE